MKKVLTLTAAFALAAMAFTITMLTKPPKSEARPGISIDTRALTNSAGLLEEAQSDAN
ncbi:hypothetical protein ABEV34_00125 [Methylorubrum rhodesianum]|jgi:hypothetical protein|uniref:hypothetical protein n=1 Tax=Methylorubrum TaxID=2282523 RepID=UPI00034B42BC|nr:MULTISPECIES: hypothetical protein [Methylorubrum]MBB5764488.1 hypothetical protein [Methylorubrum rhodesianum]MBK3402793.1 hypothetical protein [Methylorubrum rhodesianum]MBY0139791.1 hypothetical protein [Methylorubrum populi]